MEKNYRYLPYFFAVYTLLISIIFVPLYTGGDQILYIKFHQTINENIELGYKYYKEKIGASEMGYYYLVRLLGFIDKNSLTIIFNTILGFLFGLVIRGHKISPLVAILLSTNYYYFALLFSLERLKISIILILLSILIKKNSSKYILQGAALFFHTQSILFIYLINTYRLLLIDKNKIKLFTIKNSKILAILIAVSSLLFLKIIDTEAIITKLIFYNNESQSMTAIVKSILLMALIFYFEGKNNLKIFYLAIPIFILTIFIGGTRLNIVLFSILIYLGISNESSKKGIFSLVLLYYSVSGALFLSSIYKYGHGDYSGILFSIENWMK